MIRKRFSFSTPDPNNPEFLVGGSRQHLCDQFLSALKFTVTAQTTSLLLVLGPYGSGKTHLLKWFIKKSETIVPKLINIYIEAPREHSFSRIAERFCEQIRKTFPNMVVEPEKEDPLDQIANIVRRLSKKGYGFCLLIDEFENAWRDTDLVYKIRELIDVSPPGLLVVLSAAASEFDISQVSGPLQARANQIFFLEPFSEEDARKLVKSCSLGEVRFTDEAIGLINSVADGIPRKIIGLAHATMAVLEMEGKYTVSVRDVEKTLSNEQVYRLFRSTRFLARKQKIIPYLLYFDAALISLVGFFLIFVASQPFSIVMAVCLLLILVLYPIERLFIEIYEK